MDKLASIIADNVLIKLAAAEEEAMEEAAMAEEEAAALEDAQLADAAAEAPGGIGVGGALGLGAGAAGLGGLGYLAYKDGVPPTPPGWNHPQLPPHSAAAAKVVPPATIMPPSPLKNRLALGAKGSTSGALREKILAGLRKAAL